MIVIGIDPGFASIGIAVMELHKVGETFKGAYVFRTAKSDKKRNVKAADDNFRRAQEIARHLNSKIVAYRPHAICAESMSSPRNASTAAKMALAWGVVASIAEHHEIPMVQASPQEIKKAVCGAKNASKDNVRFAVEQRLGECEWPKETSLIEHAADATAVILACLNSEVIRAIRRAEIQVTGFAPRHESPPGFLSGDALDAGPREGRKRPALSTRRKKP